MVGMIEALRIFRVFGVASHYVLGPYNFPSLVPGLTPLLRASELWVLTACLPIDRPQRQREGHTDPKYKCTASGFSYACRTRGASAQFTLQASRIILVA